MKRIVGLPNESLRIHDGDLFTNEVRVQKSWSELSSLSVLVYDSRFEIPSSDVPVWRTPGVSSNWVREDTEWLYRGEPHADGRTRELDPLEFVPPGFIPGIRSRPSCVTDYNPFDQTSSRVLNPVNDLRLRVEIDSETVGPFSVIAKDGWHKWRVHFEFAPQSIRIQRDGELIRGPRWQEPRGGRLHAVEVALCDGRLLIHCGESNSLQIDAIDRGPRSRPEIPFSLVADSDATIRFKSLLVYRDVHYVADRLGRDTWRLDDDEYFLIGDYSPLSIDSRDALIGPIDRSRIVGLVEPMERRATGAF
jgi:hypothetical protein